MRSRTQKWPTSPKKTKKNQSLRSKNDRRHQKQQKKLIIPNHLALGPGWAASELLEVGGKCQDHKRLVFLVTWPTFARQDAKKWPTSPKKLKKPIPEEQKWPTSPKKLKKPINPNHPALPWHRSLGDSPIGPRARWFGRIGFFGFVGDVGHLCFSGIGFFWFFW